MEKNPTFFVSSRGGKKLAFEGFTYNKDKKDEKTGKLYWRCENRSCKGRMITGNDERILIVDKHHPNIYSFLDKLRGEQSRTETVIEKLISGQKPTESRQKTKRANEQIQRIVREFDERPVLDFLKGISYNIKY